MLSNSSAVVTIDDWGQETQWQMTSNTQVQKNGKVRTVGSYGDSEVQQMNNTIILKKKDTEFVVFKSQKGNRLL